MPTHPPSALPAPCAIPLSSFVSVPHLYVLSPSSSLSFTDTDTVHKHSHSCQSLPLPPSMLLNSPTVSQYQLKDWESGRAELKTLLVLREEEWEEKRKLETDHVGLRGCHYPCSFGVLIFREKDNMLPSGGRCQSHPRDHKHGANEQKERTKL